MLIGYLMAKWAASIGFFFTMLWGYNWQMMVGWSARGFTTLDKPWELVSRESGTGFVRLQHDIKWLLTLSTSYCGYKQQFRVYGFVQKLDLRMGNDDDDGDDWRSSNGIGIGPLKKNDLALVRRCICGCWTSLDSGTDIFVELFLHELHPGHVVDRGRSIAFRWHKAWAALWLLPALRPFRVRGWAASV